MKRRWWAAGMGSLACGIAMAAQVWAADAAVDAAVGKLKAPEVAVRIAAARELADLGARCAPRLGDIVPALGDEYFDVRQQIGHAIVACGKEGIPHLRNALKSDSYFLQAGALRCLAELRAAAAEAAPDVARLLRGGGNDVGEAARTTLESMGPEALLAVSDSLFDAFQDASKTEKMMSALRMAGGLGDKAKAKFEPRLRKMLESSDRDRVVFAVEMLRKVGAEVSMDKIVEILKRDVSGNAKWFARLVKEQAKDGAWAVPVLLDAMNAVKEPWDVAEICLALESVGPAASAAVPRLTEALKHPEAPVQRYAARALSAMGPEGKKALPELKALLERTKDAQVRDWVGKAVTQMESEKSAAP